MYCVITLSLLKHTDLNITEFLPKTLLFHEYCASSDLSQDSSVKIANYEIWNYSLGSTLQFSLFKLKIRLLESDQKSLRHGSSTKPHLSLCISYQSSKQFLGKINLLRNTGHLDKNNDVNHKIFSVVLFRWYEWFCYDVRKFYQCSRNVDIFCKTPCF